MKRLPLGIFLFALLLLAACTQQSEAPAIAVQATPGDLLLTEIVVTPTAGEFVEIHNAGGSPVDLSDVYLTDATFAGGSTYYYNIVTGSNAGGGGFSDFHARFPDGASIGAGEYQTVAMSGSAGFLGAYGFAPTYELFDDGSADGEAVMREALPGSINGQGGLTNSGEVVVLYQWDGLSDLVADLDYFVWGDKDEAVDKSGVAIDGPDGDSTASSYLNDTAIASQDVVASGSHASGSSWQRDDPTEGAETETGGNGALGHDETSEDLSSTWCEASPTPNAASACPAGPTAVKIHEIQGAGASSPLAGELVVVEGIVVGDFQDDVGSDGDLNGFFIQEEDADADGDAATSEGIFVFQGSDPSVDVAAGDLVEVTGTVVEFSTSGGASLETQLSNVDVTVVSSGNPLPAATEVILPFATTDAPEAFEGMLVRLPQSLSIVEYFNFDRFGEMVLATDRQFQPTAVFAPGSGDAADLADVNARSRITLDDGLSSQNPEVTRHPNGDPFGLGNRFRGGDLVTDVVGVVGDSFGLYRIQPTDPATYTAVNARQAAPEPVGGSLTVASFNVLNYFLTLDQGASRNTCGPLQDQGCRGADNAEEFARQRAKILEALAGLDADIVGLIEMENTTGVEPLANIVAGLNVILGAGSYAYVETGTIGSDAIKVGFIYRPASALPIGDFAILDSSVDPTFDDSKNRPVLAQTFVDLSGGGAVTVAVNHLKSKGSPCDDVGDPTDPNGQGNCNGVRTAAATALAGWLAGDPTGSGQADTLIIGDLNAYDKEDPISALIGAGYTDLVAAFQGEFAYSYVFDGQLGYLDHALANAPLSDQVTGTTAWHINADEPDLLDYDTSFKSDGQDAIFDPNTPFRASDHDPVLVGLALDVDVAQLLDEVAALEADGVLNAGQANALSRKLGSAQRQLDGGKIGSVTDILNGFIDQVNDFVADGILSAGQGASLTDKAEALLAGL